MSDTLFLNVKKKLSMTNSPLSVDILFISALACYASPVIVCTEYLCTMNLIEFIIEWSHCISLFEEESLQLFLEGAH